MQLCQRATKQHKGKTYKKKYIITRTRTHVHTNSQQITLIPIRTLPTERERERELTHRERSAKIKIAFHFQILTLQCGRNFSLSPKYISVAAWRHGGGIVSGSDSGSV